MDPLITSILASFLTTMATKGAEAPAHTFNLLWQATFGRWDQPLQDYIQRRNDNLRKYADDIISASQSIPDDCIKSEPNLSILGPALEASKYYIDDETIRKMFANLIAASFDKRSDNDIHHSYVDIIRQMSPNDAVLLSIIKFNGTIATPRLMISEDNYSLINGRRDIVLIPPQIVDDDPNNTISLSNLARLGLVEIDHILAFSNDDMYSLYKQLPIYHRAQQYISTNVTEYKEIKLEKGMFTITPLGESFKKICLKYK